jgi:hypothetical protein
MSDKIQKFRFKLTSLSPMLMHRDSIDWADTMEAWKNDSKNSRKSKAGDDRTPAWRWVGYTYTDGDTVGIPFQNLSASLMKAASSVPVPGGKGGKTFKSDTMSGMSIDGTHCPLVIPGIGTIKMADITKLLKIDDWTEMREAVKALGFRLDATRATVGMSKHIRVRPIFDKWTCEGTCEVWDERLAKALPEIFEIAGARVGIGDWRPSSPKKPGPFGRFTAEVSLVK